MTALFRRLNLRSLQCEELRIITYVKISSKLAKRIIVPFRGRVTRNTPRYAVYGITYTVNKIPHVVRVDFQREEGNEYRVEFKYVYVDQEQPKPPKNIKSPQLLIDLLNEETQDVGLICLADFAYKQDEWRSTIEIPMALNSSKESNEPFTHVEAIEFSRREKSNVEYSVLVGKLEDGTTIHTTYLDEPWKGKLTKEIPTLLLKRSNILSKVLVSKKRQRKYGS